MQLGLPRGQRCGLHLPIPHTNSAHSQLYTIVPKCAPTKEGNPSWLSRSPDMSLRVPSWKGPAVVYGLPPCWEGICPQVGWWGASSGKHCETAQLWGHDGVGSQSSTSACWAGWYQDRGVPRAWPSLWDRRAEGSSDPCCLDLYRKVRHGQCPIASKPPARVMTSSPWTHASAQS